MAALAQVASPPSLRKYFGALVLTALFVLFWFRQYDSFDGPGSFLYDKAVGGFRWVDLFLISFILVHAILLLYARRKWFNVPSSISRPSWVFLAVVAFACFYGWRNGGVHLFFDWREIVLGAALTIVFSYWVRTPAELKFAAQTFAVVFGLRILAILAMYLAGGGVDVVLDGVRTPLYDGSTLSSAGFLAILGLSFSLQKSVLAEKLFWVSCAVVGYLIVFGAFRRSFWGELFISSSILLLSRPKARLKIITAIMVPALVVVVLAGTLVYKRLLSFDVASSNAEYSETNLDHVNDVLDAMDHVREHPIAGIGLGRPYQTFRIVQWKKESSVVHNALVHVWLFYGLAGLVTYIWFHVNAFRWLRRFRRNSNPVLRAFAGATFAYVIAQFIIASGFSPWPYGQLPTAILLAFLFGSLFASAPVVPTEGSKPAI